jgi:hypothetical protein
MVNETENHPAQEKTPFLKWFIEHFLTRAILGIATAISLSIAIYKSLNPYPPSQLTYYISSTRVPIVQSGKLDNFFLTYYGKQVTGDLSSAEIQIWNAGNRPIKRQDILQPIILGRRCRRAEERDFTISTKYNG